MKGVFGDIDAALALAERAGRIPVYASAFAEAGVAPDTVAAETFFDLPLLSKQDLIDAARESPPFGGRLTVPYEKVTAVFVAPGPVYMPFTEADFEAVWAAQARTFAACGFAAGDIVDNTLSHQWVLGGALVEGGLKRAGCAVVSGGPGNTDLHLETIVELGVTGIIAFPTFLEKILETARERGLELPLRIASISGEIRRSDFKQQALSEFGVVVRERYGVSEVGSMAYECTAGAGMHLREDLLIETIDPDSEEHVEMSDPEPKELVVTDPLRSAMPIVRLRTGDMVGALATDRCACGREAPRIERIVGRTDSIPRIKGMFVIPRQVGDVLLQNGIQARHQLRIERPDGQDRLTIVLERDGAATPIDEERLRAAFRDALRIGVELAEVDRFEEDVALVDDRREVR